MFRGCFWFMQFWLIFFVSFVSFVILALLVISLFLFIRFCFSVSRQDMLGLGVVLSWSILCYPMYITLFYLIYFTFL